MVIHHYDLKMLEPSFNSHLMDLIIELDYLRKKRLSGTTHPLIFFQLKDIFHSLESLGSARLEGNYTTMAELVDSKILGTEIKDESKIEIHNMEEAMDFIDEVVKAEEYPIDRIFISELHKKVVRNLIKEGSKNPGEYRKVNNAIRGSNHTPPDYSQVENYMSELFSFINSELPHKYDLLKTAITHHRFLWIHPFDNGNGRTVRLLTYAMLAKLGFNVHLGRIINPTAVFCVDREKYNQTLANADKGDPQAIYEWCEYVLEGLKREIEKIDKLLDYPYLQQNILLPAIAISLERKVITPIEARILNIATKKQVLQAGDLKEVLPNKLPAEISRVLRRLKEKRMIMPTEKKSRKYVLSFYNNYLLRGIIQKLDDCGFLPIHD